MAPDKMHDLLGCIAGLQVGYMIASKTLCRRVIGCVRDELVTPFIYGYKELLWMSPKEEKKCIQVNVRSTEEGKIHNRR
jgi:hypothetical protein